ncbi:MAG: alpha/beta hydrolase, partial [bacterium]|nr:alpha/beta hydrolase [bacterium]
TREHKGTALLFHGYASEKSSLLPVAKAFHRLGFDTMAMDFPGHGESDGFKTTIGFHEAADVLAAFNYARLSPKNKHKKIILYGFSIGAVAIMRAIHLYKINPDCIILECPFGSLLQALSNRLVMVGLPAFPLANLMVFWGSTHSGYWGFDHSPADYAKDITVPTLLMYGLNDKKVTRKEIDDIFRNLKGPKVLNLFKNMNHQLYIYKQPGNWFVYVEKFLTAGGTTDG